MWLTFAVVLGTLAVFPAGEIQAQTAPPLVRAQKRCTHQIVMAGVDTARQLFDNVTHSSHTMSNRAWFCATNLSTTTTNIVYISTFNTQNDHEGSPVYGSQTRCWDWGANIMTWPHQKTGGMDEPVQAEQCE